MKRAFEVEVANENGATWKRTVTRENIAQAQSAALKEVGESVPQNRHDVNRRFRVIASKELPKLIS